MTPTNHRTQAPYDILTAQQALIEAAKLNRRAMELVANLPLEFDASAQVTRLARASDYATVAHSLATYALVGEFGHLRRMVP